MVGKTDRKLERTRRHKRVRKIEFICRKVNQMPLSENMTIYRE